jgi:hypothetical protein
LTSQPASSEITDGTLRIAAAPVLEGLAPPWSVVEDTTGSGAFLRSKTADAACFLELPLGRLSGMISFTSCHRYSPLWTKPANGTAEAEVQPETLWLLAVKQ